MDKYIGHFMETSKDNGNVGLAAHNRGYKVNYFSNLKKLEKGDLVIYTYKGKSQNYTVTSKEIIKDTDWSKLENSTVNKLTMITCIENKPEYRLCVQATEIENKFQNQLTTQEIISLQKELKEVETALAKAEEDWLTISEEIE